MQVRDVRFLTIMAALAVFGWTLWRGVMVADYEFIADRPMARDHIAATFGPWTNERGVASLARENLMRAAPNAADPRQNQIRRDQLADVLSVLPLSSQYWLELAVMRNAAAQPGDKITEALAMSSLIAPNEAEIILRRAAFSLSIWEKLDPEARERTINDLAVVTPPLDQSGIRLALAIKTPKIRADVREMLAARGVAAPAIQYIGL